ncbi:MAG: hypothetical protein ACXVAY_16350 [Mucilaginibacter sp.]
MLNCYSIILNIGNRKREVLVSPLMLQSKEPPDIQSGKINKLFFYEHLFDEEYKANLTQGHLADKFKADNYIINYGQDFDKYYLGCLNVDFDNKRYWEWNGQSGKLDDNDVKTLGESLFNADVESRSITIFTPTRPSDFKLRRDNAE